MEARKVMVKEGDLAIFPVQAAAKKVVHGALYAKQ
jgi:hypothetical protein